MTTRYLEFRGARVAFNEQTKKFVIIRNPTKKCRVTIEVCNIDEPFEDVKSIYDYCDATENDIW